MGLAALLVLAAACGSSGAGTSHGAASSADQPPPAGSTAKHRHHHHSTRPKRDRRVRPRVPAADVPNRRLTPGAALTTKASVVCRSGYASRVRDVPESEKNAVYGRYGVAHVPYAHEVDHLVSLELGGSNAIANLWPEPYAGRWGARTKDALENRLHDLVCSGAIRLRAAQRIEARNWVAAYRRYVGSPPAASGGGERRRLGWGRVRPGLRAGLFAVPPGCGRPGLLRHPFGEEAGPRERLRPLPARRGRRRPGVRVEPRHLRRSS